MKKTMLTFLGVIVAVAASMAGDSNTLTVKIKNLKNTDGKLQVSLFSSEANWLSEGEGEAQIIQFDDKAEVLVSFDNVSAGTYAVSVIHDENSNGDLDAGLFGIPTEDYGFSNDAQGRFGPASFEDSKFEVTGDSQIEININ